MTYARGGSPTAPRELPARPHNLETERAILGAVLIEDRNPGSAIRVAREMLKSEDFFPGANRIIFRRTLETAEPGQAIEPVALIYDLKRWDELERVAGAACVSSVTLHSSAVETRGTSGNQNAGLNVDVLARRRGQIKSFWSGTRPSVVSTARHWQTLAEVLAPPVLRSAW